jgi:hypothetical protein
MAELLRDFQQPELRADDLFRLCHIVIPVRAWPVALPSEICMAPSNDTIREIAKALRRHVDAPTLEKVVNELLDVRGNRDFRDGIQHLARELMRR